ncbi:MAG: hypothetical protein Q8Q60_05360 [Candidatus Chromulinivorax sp.]|nr:hypothetical protein [Candidatus Chromulinivorax sp.]
MKKPIYQHQKIIVTLAILLSCSSIILTSENNRTDQIIPVLLTAETPASAINPQIHMNYYNLVNESVHRLSHPRTFKIQCCTNFSCFKMTTEEEIITCQDSAIITRSRDFFISHKTYTIHTCCCICQIIHKHALESVD